MRFGTAVLVALTLLAAGCEGGGGAPLAPTPGVTLPNGDYLLAVYSFGFSCQMVTYSPGGFPGSAAQIPVSVAADGDRWQVISRDAATGSLSLVLSRTGVGVSGTAAGTLTPPGISVTLQHQLSGTANGSADGVVGSVAGTVNYASAGGTAFCSSNLWSLTRDR